MKDQQELVTERIGLHIGIIRGAGWTCQCDTSVGHVCEVCDLTDVLCESRREIERLQLYERAMKSMAAQFICPKMTAREMAEKQLEVKATK